MKGTLKTDFGQRNRLVQCPRGRNLARLFSLGLLFLANQALAGYTYSMVGGECTDSNRPEVFYPDAGETGMHGPGPTLCNKDISVQITMRDGYVPGTRFLNFDEPGATLDVESFSFSDGARSFSTTFPHVSRWGQVDGVLPVGSAPSELNVFWYEGWFFRARNDGSWIFGEEFGARDGVCGLGSVEGPNVTGDACAYSGGHYASVGTYLGWHRVPEPSTAAILALGLAAMGGLGYRRRKAPSLEA